MSSPDVPGPAGPSARGHRRQATALQAKAAAHPLRLRILRLCALDELTNKQIAARLGALPGTTHHHVRLLVEAGLLEPGEVRSGPSGALEKPYRTTGLSWWLDGRSPGASEVPLAERSAAVLQAFAAEVAEAGPSSVRTFARFVLHLDQDDVREFDARILAVVDDYISSEPTRLDKPAVGGLVVLHSLDDPASEDAAKRDGGPILHDPV